MKIKRWIGMMLIIVVMFAMAGCGANDQTSDHKGGTSDNTAQTENSDAAEADVEENAAKDSKILVVYFSYTGHLDSMAHWIADETGGDLVRVTAKEAYPEDYDETVDRAKKEKDEDARPEINVELTSEQLAGYDTVFFGFPVWWYDIPMSMYTFLDSYEFSGKTIIPFLSHEGSSNGGSAKETIEEHARGANVRYDDMLSIKGGKVDSSEQDVRNWVDSLGFGR